MEERNQDEWLLAGGVLYAAVSSAVLLLSSPFGPAGFHPLLVPLMAGVAACTAVGLSDWYPFRWWALALFLGWVGLVACVQWIIYAAALAAV